MDEPTKKVSLDQYELDEIYLNRYPGQQGCPTCGVTLSSARLCTRLKFMGEPAHLEIYALTCDNCQKLVRTVGCNLEFLLKDRPRSTMVPSVNFHPYDIMNDDDL